METGWPLPREGRLRCCTKNVTVYWGWIRLTSYVGLNAGIVYNSDPTSRISNYILICIQPNIWRLSGEYISTFQSAEISASISAKCLSAKKSLHIVGLYKSPPSNLLNSAVFHLWKEFPLFTPEKFPTQKPIKRGGLIRLEEIGRGGEAGWSSEAALKAEL